MLGENRGVKSGVWLVTPLSLGRGWPVLRPGEGRGQQFTNIVFPEGVAFRRGMAG